MILSVGISHLDQVFAAIGKGIFAWQLDLHEDGAMMKNYTHLNRYEEGFDICVENSSPSTCKNVKILEYKSINVIQCHG